jgi:hypothetical protein
MEREIRDRLIEFIEMIGESEGELLRKTNIDLNTELSLNDLVRLAKAYNNISMRWLLVGEGHAMLDGSFNIMNFHAENINLAGKDACKGDLVKSLSTELAEYKAMVRSLTATLEKISSKDN